MGDLFFFVLYQVVIFPLYRPCSDIVRRASGGGGVAYFSLIYPHRGGIGRRTTSPYDTMLLCGAFFVLLLIRIPWYAT